MLHLVVCVNAFDKNCIYVYNLEKVDILSLAEKIFHLSRESIHGAFGATRGNLSNRGLSGSERAKGGKTREGVWKKVLRPDENGTYF